jgi:hypothetical protein
MIALLAVVACFLLVPIAVILLLKVFFPWLFEDDTLGWVFIIAWPVLLAPLTGLSLLAGILVFSLAKARLRPT